LKELSNPMSYENEVSAISALGRDKALAFRATRLKSLVGGMQAGAYVGIGIVLIMTLGATVPAEIRPLVMGSTFGLALILVVISGAELFTGYNLYTAVALANKQITTQQAFSSNVATCSVLFCWYRFTGWVKDNSPTAVVPSLCNK